jgi:hypothetical protein
MELTSGGRLISFNHQLDDSVALPSVSHDAAKVMADSILKRLFDSFGSYTLTSTNENTQLKRVEHKFVYTRHADGLDLTLTTRIQGNQLGSFDWTGIPPSEFDAAFSRTFTQATLIATASVAVTFFLFFFIVVLFLKKYHEGEVGTRTAVSILIGYVVLALLLAINTYSGMGSTWNIGDLNKFNVRMIVFVFTVCIVQVFLGVLVFSAWSVGESFSRTAWPGKLLTVDSVLFRKFFTTDISRSMLAGFGWGGVLLGIHGLTALVLALSGAPMMPMDSAGIGASAFPGIYSVGAGLLSAVFGEIVYRLFFLSYFRERFKSTIPGFVASVAIWTLSGYAMWDIPFAVPSIGAAFGILAAYGVVFALLYLRYDLLTAIVAHVIIVAVAQSVPLLTSTGSYLMLPRITFGLALALPLVVAVIGSIRRDRFEMSTSTMPEHIRRISDRVRMAKELEIARNVQLSLLPKDDPRFEGFDIAGVCIPALEVGGDYFDFVSLGSKRLGLALGDVSGKGVPAAIYMTLTKGILQSHAEDDLSPKDVLSKVNSLMYRTIERNSFVSMLYAILDSGSMELRFSRAGQCPVVLARHTGGSTEFLTPRGMALGLESGTVFDSVLEEKNVKLRSGEIVVFYTDGFTEAMNEHEEEFGEERLSQAIDRHRNRSAAEIISLIVREIGEFAGSRPQHDDMTMIVVKVSNGKQFAE